MNVVKRSLVKQLANNAGISEADMWDQMGATYGKQDKLDEAIWCMQFAIECRFMEEAK